MDEGERSAEAELVLAARRGDREAFGHLVEPFRDELRAHCYRMLASVHDAEDAVQDTFDRAWRALGKYEERGSIRPWLYKIATNRALTLIERRARRELPTDMSPEGAPAVETAWVEPYPGRWMAWTGDLDPEARVLARESVEIAFVAALQHLSATQRAALLLCDVLGYPAREAAEVLETTTAAVNSALQRARKAVPETSQQRTLDAIGEAAQRDLVRRYTAAWEAQDIDSIVAMLAEDAKYAMPPLAAWYEGHAAIRAFLSEGPMKHHWRFLPAQANGQLAFGTYMWDDARAAYVPAGLDLLVLRDALIAEVVSFLDADFARFGLPMELPGPPR